MQPWETNLHFSSLNPLTLDTTAEPDLHNSTQNECLSTCLVGWFFPNNVSLTTSSPSGLVKDLPTVRRAQKHHAPHVKLPVAPNVLLAST